MAPRRHVLIADPDESERARVKNAVLALGADNFAVHEAQDGAQALALLDQHDIRLVVCEVLLDEISGLNLLRRLQQDHGDKAPPVIFITDMTRELDRYWGLRNGAHAYLPKPYDESRLRDRITKALAGSPKASPERIED